MAQLKIKNLKQIETSIRKRITKELRSKEVRRGVAQIVVDDIKDGSLGKPAEFTKDMRQYLEQFNKTDPRYRRGKISINFTGELLQDLINNVKAKFGSGKSSFVIEHSNKTHKPYKQGKRKLKFSKKKIPKSDRVTYSFISNNLINRLGYNYLKFSDNTQAKVIKFIRDKIFKNLS